MNDKINKIELQIIVKLHTLALSLYLQTITVILNKTLPRLKK